MTIPKIPQKYQKVWTQALPCLKECRKTDIDHSSRIAEAVFKGSKNKKWDLDILIPIAIFHDIGHASILPEHLWMITGPKKLENAKLVHMLTGAKIANEILTKLKWPRNKVKEIVAFISIHDNKDQSLFDTEEKKFFNDIDKLDRYTEKGFEDVLKEFGISAEKAYKLLKDFSKQLIDPKNQKIADDNLENLKVKYKIN